MVTQSLSGPMTSLDGAVAELCRLIEAIDQSTDLFERHSLARSLAGAANVVRVLRVRNGASYVSPADALPSPAHLAPGR